MVKNINKVDYSGHKINRTITNTSNTDVKDLLLDDSVIDDIVNKDKEKIEEYLLTINKSIYQDRFAGDYNGYNSDSLDIIVSNEYRRDENGNKIDLAYNDREELVNDLDKLKDIYSDYDGFAYYNQNLYPENYKYASIQDSGCCPTCFAMVATYLTGENVVPTDVIEAFKPYCFEPGTDVTGDCFPDVSEEYDIKPTRLDVHNKEELLNELEEGNPIILNVVKGNFTGTGHYIVLLGLDNDGNVVVADPNSVSNSTKSYSIDSLMNQAHDTESAAWSFEKNKEVDL